MAEPSSPASSGSEGYTFEDRLGAWWLLHLLDGTLPFDVSLGPLRAVRLQVEHSRNLRELTLTLDQTWLDNSRELGRGSARDAFDGLLHHVVGRQVQEALELADRVAGGTHQPQPKGDRQ